MPCLAVHLAIAKKYLEKHPNEDKNEFILGSIAPDILNIDISDKINGVFTDKNSRHFGRNYETTNIVEYMKNKVDFNLFLKQNELDTSFKRAYYIHLLADYYFFGEYIKDEQLSIYPLNEVIKIGYNDYDLITPYLIKKYELEIPDSIKNLLSNKGEGEIKLLKLDLIDSFIEDMSNMNIFEEIKKVN